MYTNRRLGRLFVAAMGLPLLAAGWAAASHSDHGCDSCHVPHNAQSMPGVPLWNGAETVTTFTMYSSPTFQGSIDNQPSGASRLCLSCHDGANPSHLTMNPDTTFGSNELTNSHPISFVYDGTLATTDGHLKDPSQPSSLGRTIGEDLLDPGGKMQCSSCHDVHASGVGQYMLRGYDYGRQTITNPDGTTTSVRYGPQLCRMCHLK